MTFSQGFKDFHLRNQVCAVFAKWSEEGLIVTNHDNVVPLVNYMQHLTDLLDAEMSIRHGMTEQHRETCRLLLGPHGWTIYKILLARNRNIR